jgi:carboxypeptidase Q
MNKLCLKWAGESKVKRLFRPATLLLLGVVSLGMYSNISGQNLEMSVYQRDANRIIEAATETHRAYDRLGDLVDTFGHRLSGSVALEQAIDWIVQQMENDGLENVRTDHVMVPHWERGQESATMTLPRVMTMPMLGLGGSIGTSDEGIKAEVMVVNSFEELDQRKEEAAGRIVLYDVEFTTYGETGLYRRQGAVEAAKVGAVAMLLRSVGPFGIQTPHTGSMSYQDGVPRIPAAAITMEHSMMIKRIRDRGQRVEVRLTMGAEWFPDAPSRNVMGEITGREFPEEIVVFGGHIDSWDVGQGAMDDGGGVVVAWEAIRLLKELGLRPRRTIRAVGWTSEENGGPGGDEYRRLNDPDGSNHVLAMESDGGVFSPQGFGFTGSEEAFQIVSAIGTLLEPVGSNSITKGGGGADIAPLIAEGVPGMGLQVDGSKYFWYHHTNADTLDKLDPDEMARVVATMAIMAYVVAEMPERLPR